MTPDDTVSVCDHTSVGVLMLDAQRRLLLFERATFPPGLAPPAGHVDRHGSFEDAARAEVKEEVGLSVETLRLVGRGRTENPCRRIGGSWHYWEIFQGTATGELRLSPREAENAGWYAMATLSAMAIDSGGPLEPVWRYWLPRVMNELV